MGGCRWFSVWVIASALLGCAEQHDVDGGPDSGASDAGLDVALVDAPDTPSIDAPDAGPTPMHCLALPDVPHPTMCEVDVRCEVAIDERPLAPAGLLDRPSITMGLGGRPTFLTARPEVPSIGALVTRDGTSPWIFERLATPMVRGVFAPGVDGDGEACAAVLIDDGAGTLRLVEHLAHEEVVLDALPGALDELRSMVRTEAGIFGLFVRDGSARVGFRGIESGWRDIPLPSGAQTASLARDEEGISISWMTPEGHYAGHLTGPAILRGENVSAIERLASLSPVPDTHYTHGFEGPPPRIEVAEGVILSGDGNGDLVLSRRASDGSWTRDLVADGSVPECGPPTDGATCAIHYATQLPLGVAASDDGDVVGLFARTAADVALVGGYWVDTTGYDLFGGDAGPPQGPAWLGGGCCAPPSLFLVVAEAGRAPRTFLLEDRIDLEDAALALGEDGALHILLRTGGGHRYIQRRPHGT